MDRYLLLYTEYLRNEKGMSDNSRLAYCRDLADFSRFLADKGISGIEVISNTEVVAYLFELKKCGKSPATVNRRMASLRAYFEFLSARGYIANNPTKGIRAPKIQHKEIEFLTLPEIEQLLSMPDSSPKGIRDRALLELLYASGMRVSEIAGANLSDLNLQIGFILSGAEHGKTRIIPLGRPARAALTAFCNESRPGLIGEKEAQQQALFVNYAGRRLTRQGIWKVIKEYARLAGLEEKVTPQTLRNSFAVHMIQNGADLKSVQELLGHEDLTATQIYLSATKNRIKDVYDKTHPRA